MSMNVGNDSEEGEVMVDINTTPLIDVMLVLLIMFIITIPIQTHAVKMNMPVPNAQTPPKPPEIVRIVFAFDGTTDMPLPHDCARTDTYAYGENLPQPASSNAELLDLPRTKRLVCHRITRNTSNAAPRTTYQRRRPSCSVEAFRSVFLRRRLP